MGARGVDEAVQTLAAVMAGDIEPPATVTLDPSFRPLWVAITRTRARSEWTDVDLHHAANLTRCLSDIERISAEVRAEGDVIRNERGTQIPNPKHRLLETLSQRSMTLTRLLQLHAQALVADARALVPGRRAEKALRDRIEGGGTGMPPPGRGLSMDDDDLLAKSERYQ